MSNRSSLTTCSPFPKHLIRPLLLNEENTKMPKNEEPEVSPSGPKHGPGTTDVVSTTSIVSEPQDLNKRGFDMSAGFIKLSREAEELVTSDPDVFVLLTLIALKAVRTESKYLKLNLKPSQALIGYKDLPWSEARYREVKKRSEQKYFLATFTGTTKGTIATLTNKAIYDINENMNNDHNNEQKITLTTNVQRPHSDPLYKDKKNVRKKEKKEYSSDSIEIGLSKKLFEYVKKLEKSVQEPNFANWAIHIDRLLRLNGATFEEIEETMQWLYSSDHKQAKFWRVNTLSADKLRRIFQGI